MTVYLCGPINGMEDADAKNWRDAATRALTVPVLDPMRRDYRGVEDQNVEAIVAGDLEDIAACDILLVWAMKGASWGTAMEVWHAKQQGKRIVVVAWKPISPWLRYCASEVYVGLGEALDAIEPGASARMKAPRPKAAPRQLPVL